MAAPRCENCRWWGADGEKSFRFPTLRKCARPDLVRLDEAPAAVVAAFDDENGIADLWTGAAFGCVAFDVSAKAMAADLAAAEGVDLVELPRKRKAAELAELLAFNVITAPADTLIIGHRGQVYFVDQRAEDRRGPSG